jgi:quercetin dioxygenase-like cupin family protein
MAIPHARPGNVIDISPLGERLTETQTTTLVKTNSLEVLRLVLPAGKQIDPHAVPGEITVQCLEGKAVFSARGKDRELTPGQMLYLAGGKQHAVRAVEDASLLVTILLNHEESEKDEGER